MSNIEILSLVITIVCLLSFSVVFTVLFRNFYLTAIVKIENGQEDIDLIDNAIIEEKAKKSKKGKTLFVVGKVVSWTLLGIVLVGFGFSLYARIAGNTMIFGDSGMIVIASGSMEKKNSANYYLVENNLNNQIATYDIIQLEKYHSEDEVGIYDVVAFKSESGTTIVHRIISVTVDPATSAKRYITRGDANGVSDDGSLYQGYLHYDDFIGFYTGYRIPVLGAFVVFLQSNAGIITILSVVYCLGMFDHYKGKYEKAIVTRTNMLVELLDYDLATETSGSISTSYSERLIYKGQEYRFDGGKFVSKSVLEDTAIAEKAGDDLVVVKSEDGHGTVSIKDTTTNETTTVSFKEGDAGDPLETALDKKDKAPGDGGGDIR